MTTRRNFIKVAAALPMASYFKPVLASTDPSRLALIIGNSAYTQAPLGNPTNDAKAVTNLFTQAGFTVDSRLNVSRADMLQAIEKFGMTVKRSETKLAVFYYAGHGAQLDWQNYLLPVDALVERQEDMKQRCVDLSLLLGQLREAKGKTFIIILDACRNNPFGTAYRPEQKGLSQFDAPVGSLLAYATSPGSVASDGEGQNGLYTENLVRELAKRGTRIEDALKRVRLNVRLASHGEQIPWETTSLEGDVFIFNESQKKLTEAELEKHVEADMAEWARIKSSKKTDDWVSYLQTFPNGRFAEIAQMRLTRLLAETEKIKPVPVQAVVQSAAVAAAPAASQTPTPVAAPEGASKPAPAVSAPMINVGAGLAVPMLMAPSANPNSAGRYPLGRVFTVGDEATIRTTDILTGVEERTFTLRVTKVDHDGDRVELNDGDSVRDLMGNIIKAGRIERSPPNEYSAPAQVVPVEFQLGKKWTTAFTLINGGVSTHGYADTLIAKREFIEVPAGKFDTFRIDLNGWTQAGDSFEVLFWLTPRLNFPIKMDRIIRRQGRILMSDRQELTALRQHSIDAK